MTLDDLIDAQEILALEQTNGEHHIASRKRFTI